MSTARDLPTPNLREALRRARAESAERSGVLVELRTAELARLDILKEELGPLFAQVPQEIDLFDAAIMPGDPARLFVDVLGFVEMGRDKRTYRFFQDNRYGRTLIAEDERLDKMVEAITDYVARRLVEREKALASDTVVQQPAPAAPTVPIAVAADRQGAVLKLFLIGLVVALLAYYGTGMLWEWGLTR